jgi:hypothetical protein
MFVTQVPLMLVEPIPPSQKVRFGIVPKVWETEEGVMVRGVEIESITSGIIPIMILKYMIIEDSIRDLKIL